MRNKIKIRIADPADLNDLTRLFVSFQMYFCELDGKDNSSLSIADCKSEIRRINFSKDSFMRTFLAETDGRIIGAISFYKGYTTDYGAAYHLPFLFISPEYRGSRTALMFFDRIKKLARKEKIKTFIFSVYGLNKNAVRLYEHIGAKYWADRNEHFMYMNTPFMPAPAIIRHSN